MTTYCPYPTQVEFIIESQWGLGMFLYVASSHLPFVCVSLNVLVIFQPDAPLPLCRSYEIANTYIELLSMFFDECIFALRAFAVWERERWPAIFAIVNIIAYLVPIIICFKEFDSSVSGECWIPGVFGYLGTKLRSKVYVVYGLLAVVELQILFLLLYRAVKGHGGWKTDNRLMRGLLQHNLLYFSSSFGWFSHITKYLLHIYLLGATAFTLGVVLTAIFLPFPFAHVVAEFVYSQFVGDDYLFDSSSQVIVQAVLVTRMHRDFWRSNRTSCGTHTDISFTTWMAAVPDII
ncbi:uncharacterized protein BJ212DRAFT_1477513 [Suillus subaureus]|uniref:Uncharacterized protein n=1 Tax=Suillus subaureus TaxID=48587 RepID=A0A9P7EH27_9AGAM|nr:uncharacterized protein BJ212DRAFT_1477513 [Suillus subaureus]KAG1821652.1 hypothetical protein BJ212DRAFT_1477513 [Suillus subaureus]